MASIKDAFEESFQDNHAIIKYILFAIPVYYCVHLYSNATKGDLTGFWWMFGVTYLLLFGFLIKCTTNVRNGKDHVLPSFNIFALFWACLLYTSDVYKRQDKGLVDIESACIILEQYLSRC